MRWVELPAGCCGIELANFALSEHIALSPGVVFSHRDHYTNCIMYDSNVLTPDFGILEIEKMLSVSGRT